MIIKNCSPTCKEMILLLPGLLLLDTAAARLMADINPIYWIPPVNIIKIIILLVLTKKQNYSIGLFSHKNTSIVIIVGITALIMLFFLNFISAFIPGTGEGPIFHPAGGIYDSILIVSMITSAVVFEELMYRNYLLQALPRLGLSRVLSLLLTASLFSVGHIYLGLPGVFFSFSSAIVLGAYFLWSANIGAVVLIHLAYNISILIIHGYI